MPDYRDNGATGALLDEYERALTELVQLLPKIGEEQLTATVADPDFPTIQSILVHVVRAGYNYAIAIRNHQGEQIPLSEPIVLHDLPAVRVALQEMFCYTEQLFADYPELPLEEKSAADKIVTSWGQRYDVEQLLEHAIVHILRHRRQIERRLLTLVLRKV